MSELEIAPPVARELWTLLEPIHAVIYFAPEAAEAYQAAGLKGGWMGYFASRSAALGPVSADVVVATFFNFAPPMVARAIPDAWALATPTDILTARLAAADAALRRILGDAIVTSSEVAEAAQLARAAAATADRAGRPLFAAHAALPWPDAPHLVLWHAATLLREHRGDGHVAVLTAEGIGGLEAHVLTVANGMVPRSVLQPFRGWSDAEWEDAEAALTRRGLLADGGVLTEHGHDLRARVEARTDRLATPPLNALGAVPTGRLAELVRPLAEVIYTEGGLPVPNPIGVHPT